MGTYTRLVGSCVWWVNVRVTLYSTYWNERCDISHRPASIVTFEYPTTSCSTCWSFGFLSELNMKTTLVVSARLLWRLPYSFGWAVEKCYLQEVGITNTSNNVLWWKRGWNKVVSVWFCIYNKSDFCIFHAAFYSYIVVILTEPALRYLLNNVFYHCGFCLCI